MVLESERLTSNDVPDFGLGRFLSQNGSRYRLQASPDLAPASWTERGVFMNGTGGPMAITMPIGSGMTFFRVAAQ